MIEHLLNRALLTVEPSGIRRFTALAGQIPGCLFLTIGEPEFDTPAPIKAAAKASLDAGETHYPPWAGDPLLREKICAYEHAQNSVGYGPEEVILTDGATEALFLALRGVLNEGDEVVIPTPAFGLYETITRLGGGVPIPLPLAAPDFQFTGAELEARLTGRTKALVLNSPHNPTGTVLTPETLEGVRQVLARRVAEGRPFFVVCDDVYARLAFSPCPSFSRYGELRDYILVVQSFSKPWAMTGWRLGYLLSARPVAEQLVKLHANTVVSAVSFLQRSAAAALECDPAEMRETYRRRGAYVTARLRAMGLEVPEPQGAFYAFPSVEAFGLPSERFCLELAQRKKLAIVPGACFGADGHVRISFCYRDDLLREGMDRMERFVTSLQ